MYLNWQIKISNYSMCFIKPICIHTDVTFICVHVPFVLAEVTIHFIRRIHFIDGFP